MNLRIIDARVKSQEELCKKLKLPEQLIISRLRDLSGAVLFANKMNADFLVVRGAIHDLLSMTDEDLIRAGNILSEFNGEAVLIVADIPDKLIQNFNRFINRSKIILMPDDSRKNLTIKEALQIIASIKN